MTRVATLQNMSMKYFTIVILTGTVIFGFSSCRKTYQCNCPVVTMPPMVSITVKAANDKKAIEKCMDAGKEHNAVPDKYYKDCTIY